MRKAKPYANDCGASPCENFVHTENNACVTIPATKNLKFIMNIRSFGIALAASALAANSFADGFIRWSDFNQGLARDAKISALALNDDGVAFAADSSGKLFSRNEKENAWKAASDIAGVNSLASRGRVVYAATGDGVWRSENGAAWKKIGSKENGMAAEDAFSVGFCEAAPSLLVAGHRNSIRVSVSRDDGKSWAASDIGAEAPDALVFVLSPEKWVVASKTKQLIRRTEDAGASWQGVDGDTDYFTGDLPIAAAGETLFSAKHHGLVRSADGGKTWRFQMAEHSRIVGAVGSLFFREGDRVRLRGLKDRPLTLQTSLNFGSSWEGANFGLFNALPKERQAVLWIPEADDPYAHKRLASAFGGNASRRTALLALGAAGVVRGEWMWTEKPPIIAGARVAPDTLRESDTKTRIQMTVAASDRRTKITKVAADLGAVGGGELELFDDGKHGDGAAGDKTYGNAFTVAQGVASGEKILGVIAYTDDGRVGSTAVKLNVASSDSKIIIWNGESNASGFPWLSPPAPLNYWKAQTEEAKSGTTAMELRAECSGWVGGGWNWHGWYPSNAGTDVSAYANLVFWAKLEGEHPNSLNVKLNCSSNGGKQTLGLSVFDYMHGEEDLFDGEWHEIVVPMADLLGDGKTGFDTRKAWEFGIDSWAPHSRAFSLYIDDVGFDNRFVRSKKDLVIEAIAREPKAMKNPAKVTAEIDLGAKPVAVSPYIYGAAMGDRELGKQAGLTALRSGGNPVSPHNWRTGFSSKGADWFYQNEGSLTPPERNWLVKFHGANKEKGFETYMTIPAMGRVAKDGSGVAFDTNKYQDQDSWAGQSQPSDPRPNAGSGRRFVRGADGEIARDANGNPRTEQIVADPDDTSIAVSPDEQTAMLSFMIDKMQYGTADKGGIKFVALDNEPALWHATHRGMMTNSLTYDAFWEMTENYASRIKKIDPAVQVAGPTWWGWTAYFISPRDAELCGFGKADWANPPDRAAHGGDPITVWWLKKLAEYKKQNGTDLVDILDFHFYPQTGIYLGGKVNDPATMEQRVQQTRVLWDPDYKEISWMAGDANGAKFGGKLQIIRMFKKWIAEYNPGMTLSIGEYNFGGEKDVSGGVAQAELLGVFAREGVDHAYLWFYPQPNSPIYFAFKMLRNPDGEMTAVGADYLNAKVSAKDDVSVHTYRDAKTKRLSFVLVNKRAAKDARVVLNLSKSVPEQTVEAWEYSGADRLAIGKLPARKVGGKTIEIDLPAMSVVRVDVKE